MALDVAPNERVVEAEQAQPSLVPELHRRRVDCSMSENTIVSVPPSGTARGIEPAASRGVSDEIDRRTAERIVGRDTQRWSR